MNTIFLATLSSAQIGVLVCVAVVLVIFLVARSVRARAPLPTTVVDTENELLSVGAQLERTLNSPTMFVREADRDQALRRLEQRKKSLTRHLERLKARTEQARA